jgi:hypothetical protein
MGNVYIGEYLHFGGVRRYFGNTVALDSITYTVQEGIT